MIASLVVQNPDWTTYVEAFGTLAAVAAAVAIPLAAFARQPRLELVAEPLDKRIHTRLEGEAQIPWIRLIVKNRPRRRAAHGTRVFVEHYRTPGAPPISMGNPELGWPSTELEPGGGVVVFSGGDRPIDFGSLIVLRRHDDGQPVFPTMASRDQVFNNGGAWNFLVALAMHGNDPPIFLGDRREFLDPKNDGYVLRLMVGADEGKARRYDVQLNWSADARTPADALDSVELRTREVAGSD